jgi:methionyl-tRNA synthetase
MSGRRHFYLTTAIPYVNGDPHLGHALELVQADVLARHRRLRGDDVRLLSGTDDNALKNVTAAAAAGRTVADFVAEQASRFAALAGPLQLSLDDFIRTSSDPRHRPGVERLWQACAASGDLYQRDYEGLYCAGCEAFAAAGECECPEHGAVLEPVAERNWFFRLSRYGDALLDLIESGRLRIEPRERRNEVLAFVRGGLADFSVSRDRERARGWGIPVPGDQTQVVYVWFDALGNYVTALDYGTGGEPYGRWWRRSDERRHVIGKGIVRFHAVYWPAILLSAGEPLPTTVFVHDYVTVRGEKLSKSRGGAIDPALVVDRFGADALRWWFLRDVPRSGDADFREELLAARANELADGLGNLLSRTVALVARSRPHGLRRTGGRPEEATALSARVKRLPEAIDDALDGCDLRTAARALEEVWTDANRFVSATRPWEAARAERSCDAGGAARLDALLGVLVDTCATLAHELRPFLPDAAARIAAALAACDPAQARTLFAKRDVSAGRGR